MTELHQAPRFQAYFKQLERLNGRSLLLMSRRDWNQLKAFHQGEIVEIDISRMPIAGVVQDSQLLAAVAEQQSAYESVVKVYRHDPADPKPVNVDRYLVWERLPPHRNYMQMVNTASTIDNANMRSFIADHVFVVKDIPGPDHWLLDLPPEVKAVVRGRWSIKPYNDGLESTPSSLHFSIAPASCSR